MVGMEVGWGHKIWLESENCDTYGLSLYLVFFAKLLFGSRL